LLNIACGQRTASARFRRLFFSLVAMLFGGLMLAGCNNIDLYSNLDERQANEIVATLLRNGIPAKRGAGKGSLFTVSVEDNRFAEAVRILSENGLPKQVFATFGEVFKKDGLISTPTQDKAQMIFALSQELSRTISDIDGVLSARVHLVLPENDPLRQQLLPSSASVFIRHQVSAPLANLVPQVKMLVANGVAGLAYDKVSVVLVPVEKPVSAEIADVGYTSFLGLEMRRDSVDRAFWLFSFLIVAVAALGGALATLLLRKQQRRVYPLAVVSPEKQA
jgi:type III secretion protein J